MLKRSKKSKGKHIRLSAHVGSNRNETNRNRKVTGSPMSSISKRRISCKDLGQGDCEGWLWKKKDAKSYFSQKWKKYWFILKDTCLYWYMNEEDEKAEGFVSLPEFKIDRATECKRKFAFKACHPKIKIVRAAIEFDLKKRLWLNYWSESDHEDVELPSVPKQDSPPPPYDTYPRPSSVSFCLSVSPYLEPKHVHLSSSDTFQSRSSHEEYHSEPQDGGNNNGISPGKNSSSRHNSWQDLIETPLGNARLHYLQTLPVEGSLLHEDRAQLAMEYRRQSTLPAQRSLLQEQYGPLPVPINPNITVEAGGKPRSFTLPRDSGLHAVLAAAADASDHREPQHYHYKPNGIECVFIPEHLDRLQADSLGDLYRALERTSLSTMEDHRPATRLEYKRSFVRRVNDPLLSEKLHRLRILHNTLKVQQKTHWYTFSTSQGPEAPQTFSYLLGSPTAPTSLLLQPRPLHRSTGTLRPSLSVAKLSAILDVIERCLAR
uniref:Connector enhancer of kinase suppressor of Ras 2b n=1 Tax=Myripristis murdjan TaxID=586833 RepID=A0A668A0Y6_9TELE